MTVYRLILPGNYRFRTFSVSTLLLFTLLLCTNIYGGSFRKIPCMADSLTIGEDISTMYADMEIDGKLKQVMVKLKGDEILALSIDDVKIARADFPKYEPAIKKMVAKHREEMRKHDLEMAKHDEEMARHDSEMAEHEKLMEKHNTDMAEHEKEMKEHEKRMQQHDIQMEKHDKSLKGLKKKMAKHDEEIAAHDLQMKKHEEEMEVHNKKMKEHEIQMKKHDGFMEGLRKMLKDEGVVQAGQKKIRINFSKDELEVEGKKVSPEILEKAKKLYKKHFGKEMKNGGDSVSVFEFD